MYLFVGLNIDQLETKNVNSFIDVLPAVHSSDSVQTFNGLIILPLPSPFQHAPRIRGCCLNQGESLKRSTFGQRPFLPESAATSLWRFCFLLLWWALHISIGTENATVSRSRF